MWAPCPPRIVQSLPSLPVPPQPPHPLPQGLRSPLASLSMGACPYLPPLHPGLCPAFQVSRAQQAAQRMRRGARPRAAGAQVAPVLSPFSERPGESEPPGLRPPDRTLNGLPPSPANNTLSTWGTLSPSSPHVTTFGPREMAFPLHPSLTVCLLSLADR